MRRLAMWRRKKKRVLGVIEDLATAESQEEIRQSHIFFYALFLANHSTHAVHSAILFQIRTRL
jgi:hypothetical protein